MSSASVSWSISIFMEVPLLRAGLGRALIAVVSTPVLVSRSRSGLHTDTIRRSRAIRSCSRTRLDPRRCHVRPSRPRSRHHQHGPADRRRLLHLRRSVTVLAIMEASWKPCDGMSPHLREHRLSLLARGLTEPLLQELENASDGHHRPNHDPAYKARVGYLLCEPIQDLHHNESGNRIRRSPH